MLRSVTVGTDWAKKQVELARQWMLDGLQASRTQDLKAAFVSRPNPHIIYQLIWATVFDNQIGASVDSQLIELPDIGAVFDAAGFKG